MFRAQGGAKAAPARVEDAMGDAAKSALKRVLYAGGVLSMYHRLRNRHALAVAMFHRVLPPGDPRWDGAVPDWTLSDGVFDDCLKFFKRHYTVVALHDVIVSLETGRPLPPRSLLLTFDDGYADVAQYALPALRRHGLPAVIFVFSDAVGRKTRPWTEDFLQAYLEGSITREEVESVHALLARDGTCASGETAARVWDTVRRGPQLDEAVVQVALSRLRKPLRRVSDPPLMLSAEQLRNLARAGVAVGAHGKTHTALPDATDVATELREPRRALATVVAPESPDAVVALSFPHGAYTAEIVERAFEEGYRVMFTTEEELAPVPRGRLRTALIGRINVNGPAFAPKGSLRPELLAFHFFSRPHSRRAELLPRRPH